jgi:dihydropteroate synthase
VKTHRTEVMGVVNVTPDSFFAPSRASDADAVSHGRALFAQGASIVDVGGESTRPGASRVSADEEVRRVVPVVEALAATGQVSVDTVKPQVARAAVAAGATILNDVSGELFELAVELGVGWVGMHHRGIPAANADEHAGPGVVDEVVRHLVALGGRARLAGVTEVWVDPGIGFGKGVRDNLSLLARLDELCLAAHEVGCGVLVGASRKRFLGSLPHGPALDAEDRFEGSLAVATYAMCCGADVVRVHDVRATVEAATLVAAGEAA